jgi:hypothetical protein
MCSESHLRCTAQAWGRANALFEGMNLGTRIPIRSLRRALLGGVALAVAGTAGARADELSDLKAQLEALQSRVNTLEQQPAQQASNLPPGASFITFERGSRMDFVAQDPARDRINQNDDAGFTIAITPSADMPAPVAEIVVYGYVKGDVIYDLDGMKNKFSFSMPSQDRFDEDGNEFVFLHANDSRFGIKSKVDTAVGQIRTRIEMDFNCASEATDFAPAFEGLGQTYCARLRKAFGEWDMTPNWTLLAGQEDDVALLGVVDVPLVDSGGDAGVNAGQRYAQVRLTYQEGPLSWAVAMQRSIEPNLTLIPDVGSYLTYNFAGEDNQVQAVALISDVGNGFPNSDLGDDATGDDHHQIGWMVGAGAKITMADTATFMAGVMYTEGLAARTLSQLESRPTICEAADVVQCLKSDGLQRGVGVTAGMTFKVNETTSFNVEGGFAENLDANENEALVVDHVWTAHANVLWQPVKQVRMGWEVMWGKEVFTDDTAACEGTVDDDGHDLCGDSSDDVRFQWGTWFFF